MPKIVPGQLFFSRLAGGELEFSCIVVLPAVLAVPTLAWALRPADGGGRTLTCERPVHDDELGRGRAVLSAFLPPGWPDSILTIDVGGATSAHSVRVYQQQQRFGLPFGGDVLVVGGHRIGEPHRVAFDLPAQQFGWDVLPLRPGDLAVFSRGMSQPPRSADFAGYGQPVLSPGPGVVTKVIDGLPDADLLGEQQLPPGARIGWAVGNHVIIKHDNRVYSCLAHLKAGSIGVTVGQEIEARSPIGEVGSSGNVTGPHLHFHFMDGPDVVTATPLPIELTAEGETIAPTAGQIFGP